MSEPFIGEIRPFCFNYAPRGWAMCNGQILPIQQNTALFSLLGTVYGGNGKTNFALPDLQGRAPMAPGAGPGLTHRDLGESGGEAAVTLRATELPAHTHTLNTMGFPGTTTEPSGNALSRSSSEPLYAPGGTPVALAPGVVGPQSGGGGAHNNMQPYLPVYFNIALTGIFPQRP